MTADRRRATGRCRLVVRPSVVADIIAVRRYQADISVGPSASTTTARVCVLLRDKST